MSSGQVIQTETRPGADGSASARAGEARRGLLFDLATLDLSKDRFDREAIGRRNPHRGDMALLDAVLWTSDDFKRGVGVWRVKGTEFWVPGHFPGKPMLPGVLQVEAGAQMSVFLYNSRFVRPKLAAFTHIEECSFRGQVQPGDHLLILADEIKCSEKRFHSRIQGVVGNRVTFEATITGIALGEAQMDA